MNFLTRIYKNFQLDNAGMDEQYFSAAGLRRKLAKGKALPQTVHLAGSESWAYVDNMDLGDRTLVCHHADFVACNVTAGTLVHQPDTLNIYGYMAVSDSHIGTITTKGVSDISVANVDNLVHLATDAKYIKGNNLPALAQMDMPPVAGLCGYRMIDCPQLRDTADVRHISVPHPRTGENSVIDVATDGQSYIMDYFKGTKRELLDDARPDFNVVQEAIITARAQAATATINATADAVQDKALETYRRSYVTFNALHALLDGGKTDHQSVAIPTVLLSGETDPQVLIGMEIDRRQQASRQNRSPGPA